ncbi:uncharacterized protein LOC105684120 isoform X1 [Athalia rosae]|uniref:uncharacterized protein LOC105684120 isoform X1 n=2 Tax=Athalia rosae TaxID=37344 RepID=UPI002033E16E|nr:uncharacterized protein LOC105684120 isoform X1 [Athalia rosae]
MKIGSSLLIVCYGVLLSNCQVLFPYKLEECYPNGTIEGTQIPTNIRILIDVIQKAERYAHTTLDMRTMSSSLLRRFRFDGIQRQNGIPAVVGILPFGGTGPQRAKHELIEELVPGDSDRFPSEALTLTERCVLHRAISSTIWEHPMAEVEKLCRAPSEKVSGRSKSDVPMVCPIETGVIITPYGTITPGTVIASIAASLQPQSVPIRLLVHPPKMYRQATTHNTELPLVNYDKDEVDLFVPHGQISSGKSMSYKNLMESATKLDNIWVASLAGDIGEMAVYQGPIVGSAMALGATGFWNSTMQPRTFYLTDHNGHLEATRAEIIGGIDGLIIGKNLEAWIDGFHSLRLSQVLDMYYSHDGIAFDKNMKACQRAANFPHVAPRTTLTEQAHAVSQILAHRNSDSYIFPETLIKLSDYAVDKFSSYADQYLFGQTNCGNPEPRPQLEIFVAFDGAWSRDYTADFLSVMVEDLDVSTYGSRMGLLQGTTGEWLANVTHSPTTIFHALTNFSQITWPTALNFIKVFEQINMHLNKTWSKNSEHHVIGSFGQVVILLAPRTVLNQNEQQYTIAAIRQLKHNYPELRFLYYGSEFYSQSLGNLILTEEDHLIKSLKIDDLNRYLLTVPRILRPPSNLTETNGRKNQFEDYIGLGRDLSFELHPQWRINTKKVKVTFHAVGYGSMKVCSWNKWGASKTQNGFYCQELTGHHEISMSDYFDCRYGKSCPTTYYRVQNVTSLLRCSEMDCKLPSHVRYLIRMENFQYTNSPSATITVSRSLFISSQFFIFTSLILKNFSFKLFILSSNIE